MNFFLINFFLYAFNFELDFKSNIDILTIKQKRYEYNSIFNQWKFSFHQ